MSLIPLEATTRGSDVFLRSTEGWEVPLSPANAAKAGKATTNKVVLGARHSTIKLHHARVAGSIPARVYTVEPTGDITFVQLFIGGAVVNASVAPSVVVRPDETVHVEFDQERVHLFDAATTQALEAA